MSSQPYPIPEDFFRCEIEVNRSRFITSVQYAETPESAQSFIAAIKQEFPTANHNCWAYLCGPPGSTDRIGLSDDGEPHGVAGKPMLTTLQHSGLGDTVVVVTRFFGGIKLGKGGMVKAYTQAVQTAVEEMPVCAKIDWQEFSCGFDYSQLTPIKRLLPEHHAELMGEDFAAQVTLHIRIPRENFLPLQQRLLDQCAGQIEFTED